MKKIGVGYEDYTEFIDNDLYYVDKTMLIKDLLEKGGKVTLFTRPRRFGKTLALSMLQTFFELEYDDRGNPVDKSRYFEGKKIMDGPDRVLSMMGRYPVINLSLKSVGQPDYPRAFMKIREEIIREYRRHSYLWEQNLLHEDVREELADLSRAVREMDLSDEDRLKAEAGRYSTSLKTLCLALKEYHKENVIILIDEYDVPLENAYYHGFYEQMTDFIRSLFESCLKTNHALEFAVVTGCLRISKESIFTGLNHLEISSVYSNGFEEAFGFTQNETEAMLSDYGMTDRIPEAKEWYDGYLFGNTEIYNPWSIINYVKSIAVKHMKYPAAYWANTSSNRIIRDMVWHADEQMKKELDILIRGGTIEKIIHEDITYQDIDQSDDNLWSFLFFTGYMKKVSERMEMENICLTMKIPNVEILGIYKNQISNWFKEQINDLDRRVLYKAVLEDNTAGIEEFVSELLEKSISTFDSEEAFYHGFFLSLLYGLPGYMVQSNREAGIGRPDIILYPDRPKDPAIIFEIKTRKKFSEMEDGLTEAYEQIRKKKYEEGILEEGYLGVKSYGMCFCKKSCIVGNYIAG